MLFFQKGWFLLLLLFAFLVFPVTADQSQNQRTGSLNESPSSILPAEKKNKSLPVSALLSSAGSSKDHFERIRVTFDTGALHNKSMFCSVSGQNIDDGLGEKVQCTEDDILTEEKRQYVEQFILPIVKERIERLLKVEPLTTPMEVPKEICGPFIPIPSAHTEGGVEGTDVILYVVALPTSVLASNTIAWSGMCATLRNGRPAVARVNVVPRHIRVKSNKGSQRYDFSESMIGLRDERYIRAILHEVFHSLGFAPRFLHSITNADGLVNLPTLVAVAKDYFNCSAIKGIPLEDEGGEGSAGAHWERSWLMEEIMSGVLSNGRTPKISNFTLALFDHFPFYSVNFTYAEPMKWGYGAGCDFVEKNCSEQLSEGPWSTKDSASLLSRHWCDTNLYPRVFHPNETSHPFRRLHRSSPLQCTMDRSGMGVCQTGGDTLLLQGCPTVETIHVSCRGNPFREVVNDFSHDTHSVVYQGPESSCFHAENFGLLDARQNSVNRGVQQLKSALQDEAKPLCARSRCVLHPNSSSYFTQIQFGVEWISCPVNGKPALINIPPTTGYRGTVFCENAKSFCQGDSMGSLSTFEILLNFSGDYVKDVAQREGDLFRFASYEVSNLLQSFGVAVQATLASTSVTGYSLVANKEREGVFLLVAGVFPSLEIQPHQTLRRLPTSLPCFPNLERFLFNTSNPEKECSNFTVSSVVVGEFVLPWNEHVPPLLTQTVAIATATLEVQWRSNASRTFPQGRTTLSDTFSLQRDLGSVVGASFNLIHIKRAEVSLQSVSSSEDVVTLGVDFVIYSFVTLENDLEEEERWGSERMEELTTLLQSTSEEEFRSTYDALKLPCKERSFHVQRVVLGRPHP